MSGNFFRTHRNNTTQEPNCQVQNFDIEYFVRGASGRTEGCWGNILHNCLQTNLSAWGTILPSTPQSIGNLSSPKPGHTTGGSVRRGARRTVGRGEAGQTKVPTFRSASKATVPLALQGTINNCFERQFAITKKRKSYVNRWRNKTTV